jgi:serine protease inhibitor
MKRIALCFVTCLALTAASAGPASVQAKLDDRVVAANNTFGFSLLNDLVSNEPYTNTFISPLSVAMVLAMTANGAVGETRQAMDDALELFDLTPAEVNSANLALLNELASADPKVKLAVANSVWARKGLSFEPAFMNACRQYYRARAAALNFADAKSVATINGWVSQQTNGKIMSIVSRLSPEDIFVLINAVYFKGQWQEKFDPKRTENRDFHGFDKTFNVPMMARSGEFRYLESEGEFQAVELPYGDGRLSMYVFLPADNAGLPGFLDELDSDKWSGWLAVFLNARGEVVLPRFKLEYEKDLNEPLKRLGMELAFAPAADFTGMVRLGGEKAYIGLVKHKTFIEVNEEGTEAAAATAVTMVATAMPSRQTKPFEMVVDHPFFLVIRDNGTGSNLFMGAISEPRQ